MGRRLAWENLHKYYKFISSLIESPLGGLDGKEAVNNVTSYISAAPCLHHADMQNLLTIFTIPLLALKQDKGGTKISTLVCYR